MVIFSKIVSAEEMEPKTRSIARVSQRKWSSFRRGVPSMMTEVRIGPRSARRPAVAPPAFVPRRRRGRHSESRSTLTRDSLMESTNGAGQDGLQGVRLDLLRRAAGLYLDVAYPSGVFPEVVRRRLDWREDIPADEALTKPPFERTGKAPGQPTPIYALRLGNHRYPH